MNSGKASVEGSYEHRKEPATSIKGRECLGHLNDCNFSRVVP